MFLPFTPYFLNSDYPLGRPMPPDAFAVGSSTPGRAVRLFSGSIAQVGVCLCALLGLFGLTARAQTPATADLSLRTAVSQQHPAIGDVVTYTVVVANAPGSLTATGVRVGGGLPVAGAQYVPASAQTLRGTGTYELNAGAGMGTWLVGTVLPGDSAVLTFRATVVGRGVTFLTAEVKTADQPDPDSTPGNGLLAEDDYDATCFSVPILLYAGDEYSVSIPPGYEAVTWYRDNQPVSASTVSTSLATANADQSLTIKSAGTYRFVAFRNGCPASNCCDIEVRAGNYGSLGDYVFVDLNRNGIQDDGPKAGLDGVQVYLYDPTGTTRLDSTVTNGGGRYGFTTLTDGRYRVRFVTPKEFEPTLANQGTDVTRTSVAGPDGFTRVYTIDTSRDETDTLRNNPNVDAGFVGSATGTASIGRRVFLDANGDGIQADTVSEPGVAGIRVTLYQQTIYGPEIVQTATTDKDGLYAFHQLAAGDGYYVVFDTTGLRQRGYVITLPNQGTPGSDSDVGADGRTTKTYSLSAGEANMTVDAGLKRMCTASLSVMATGEWTACGNGIVSLSATTSVEKARIRWYLTPHDGAPFATVNRGESLTVSPTTTTAYYAEAFTDNGCVSVRAPVVITVTNVIAPAIAGTMRNTCPATTVDLTAVTITNRRSELTYEWYTSAERSTATRVTNLTAVGSGTYYLFANSGTCYSPPALLTATIVDCNCQQVATVTVSAGAAACGSGPVSVSAVISGSASATGVTWSAARADGSPATGTFTSLTNVTTTFAPSAADVTAGRVVLTATTNNPQPGGLCQAAVGSTLLTFGSRPAAPVGVACDDTLVCPGTSTKLIGFADAGVRINWYDGAGLLIGTTQSGGKLVVTPTKPGRVTYTAEALSANGCTSAERTSLTLTVGSCLADLAVVKSVVSPGPYRVGQIITYALTVTNKGPVTATNVRVSELLPPALTFVSATPAGQYSVGPGVWTIGTLTAGSDRSLLIETTVNATGAIRNAVTVSGDNNNPALAVDDTSSVLLDAGQCDGVLPPRIACAVKNLCHGEATTLTASGCASGTIRWSDGQTGASLRVTPDVTTVYTARCESGSACVSSVSNSLTLIVNNPQPPVITASADAVCPGNSVTLTASGCAGGTIQWSQDDQTGASITVNPYTRTTYTAQCVLNGCPSAPAQKTIGMGADLPKPTITCSTTVVCPGETMTLTVNGCVGTPVWNSTTATTASIVVAPAVGANQYTVHCSNGVCNSPESDPYTVTVVSPAVPTVTASADSVCAKGKVVLTADGCVGTVLWSNGQTGASITVNPDASISYYAQCRFRTCTSAPSPSVPITVVQPAAPIIKVDKTLVCSGDAVRLTATGCAGGTIRWSGTDQTGASLELRPAQTTDYAATCQLGSCASERSNSVRVTVNTSAGTAPVVAASKTAVCAGEVVSLTATGCAGGTVVWSDGQTGAVVSVTATPTNRQFSAVCKLGAQCGSGKSNVVRLDVTPVPTPTVTCSTSVICPGEDVTLTVSNCQGIPHWSTAATSNRITVSPTQTTSYSVYCQDGVCKSAPSGQYTITVVPVTPPTLTASRTSAAPGDTLTLRATGCTGTVLWSAAGLSGADTGAVLTVRMNATQSFSARCRFRSCTSDPSVPVTITVGGQPADCGARAGTLVADRAQLCADTNQTLVLTATANGGLVRPAGYAVLYVLTKGADNVVQQTDSASRFTVPAVAARYVVHTLVYNPVATDKNYLDPSVIKPGVSTAADVQKLIAARKVCADFDATGASITVNAVEPPVLFASSPTVCAGSTVTLQANGCDGGTVTWSDGSVGPILTRVVQSDLWLMATCMLNGCTSGLSHSIDVRLGTPAVPTVAVDKATVCAGETVTLTASGCTTGSYLWSDGKTTTDRLTITPTADAQYRVRCKVGQCEGPWSAGATVRVGAPVAPVVTIAGATTSVGSATVCFNTPVTLVAQGCPASTTVVWSNGPVGNVLTVTLGESMTYTARCRSAAGCQSAPSNTVAITVRPDVPQPNVTDLTNECPATTVDLMKASNKVPTAGRTCEYYTDPSLSADNRVTNPAAVGSGTYYLIERTAEGCTSRPVAIHVLITNCGSVAACDPKQPVTADAGKDASICAAKTYQLAGAVGGPAKSSYWTTSGTGSFDNPFAPNAIYTVSAADVAAGKVVLKLRANPANTTCPAAADSLVLTIGGPANVPTVAVAGATQLCYGDSVTLQAPAGAVRYLWSNRATTPSIWVKASGTYSVQVLDANGCASVPSAPVIVTVADPVAAPLVNNLRNVCPASVVNLTTALPATTVGSTYTYRTGLLPTSSRLTRPDSVGAGTYYVTETNRFGCVSAPAPTTVRIVNCVADSALTDLSITKTVNRPVVKRGDVVKYTIMVRNGGNRTATNVDVRDVLPAGLNLVVSRSLPYSVSNGVIRKRIDSLRAGGVDSLVFAATVVGLPGHPSTVINTAEIVYLDQRDPNLTNNRASATVQSDTGTYRPSVVGLAKSVVGAPTVGRDSLLRVTYGFTLTNYGYDTLRRVLVTDDLAYAFRPHTVTAATVRFPDANGHLRPNAAFTGTGTNTVLLDSTSYLLPNQSVRFLLGVTIRRNLTDTSHVFSNIADVRAWAGTKLLSDLSVDGNDPDPDGDRNPDNNTGVTSFTLGSNQPTGPAIGVALAVMKVTQQPDQSYNVTYKATLKNIGDMPLTGVSLTDSLLRAFAAPTLFSVVGAPVVASGSSLVANPVYDGRANANLLAAASQLAPGQLDSVLVTVNVRTAGNGGPFFSSAVATGWTTDHVQQVRDVSNNGIDPQALGTVSTPVRFNLPAGLIGIAKAVGTPVVVGKADDGVFDVPYTITVRNRGTVPLRSVQVVDDLAATFGHGALIVSNAVSVTADAGLTPTPAYTGQGLLTRLLADSLSSLPVGATRRLNFTVRVNVRNADSSTYYNSAYASARLADGTAVRDTSVAGLNDDPNNDLDPRNDTAPTAVTLGTGSGQSYIGVALAVRDTIRQPDGSFNVTYTVVVQNIGRSPLTGVSLTDTLAKTFNRTSGAVYSVVRPPVVVSTGSALKVNPAFNGDSDPRIVLGDSTSTLAAGHTDTLLVTLNVLTNGGTTTFYNSAYGSARSRSKLVSDVSTNGLVADLNGNGNPTDSNEGEPTPLRLPATSVALFIPEGFSPNGDGINDRFVIRGTAGLTISLEVYNRWGYLVYTNADYQNDWDGRSNTGLAPGGSADGLPDGTYYYVVKTSDGRKFVRYMTINR